MVKEDRGDENDTTHTSNDSRKGHSEMKRGRTAKRAKGRRPSIFPVVDDTVLCSFSLDGGKRLDSRRSVCREDETKTCKARGSLLSLSPRWRSWTGMTVTGRLFLFRLGNGSMYVCIVHCRCRGCMGNMGQHGVLLVVDMHPSITVDLTSIHLTCLHVRSLQVRMGAMQCDAMQSRARQSNFRQIRWGKRSAGRQADWLTNRDGKFLVINHIRAIPTDERTRAGSARWLAKPMT